MKELAGSVALVTGAGRNIGRAIALALADGGAAVAVNARRSQAEIDGVAREIESAGGTALAVLADVTDPAAIARMVAEVEARFGRIDILVNNAAVREASSLDEIDLARWREITGVILDGAFICAKACLKSLRAGGGTIVNIGGLSAHTGAAGRPHVVAAKAGIVGLTRALAHDLAADGVTVNCVVPGLIDTVRGETSGARSAHAGRARARSAAGARRRRWRTRCASSPGRGRATLPGRRCT